jgi:hypothetical protein
MLRVAPTVKPVEVTGINIQRIVGGQIVEQWAQFDALGLLQQLGTIPTPAEPTE